MIAGAFAFVAQLPKILLSPSFRIDSLCRHGYRAYLAFAVRRGYYRDSRPALRRHCAKPSIEEREAYEVNQRLKYPWRILVTAIKFIDCDCAITRNYGDSSLTAHNRQHWLSSVCSKQDGAAPDIPGTAFRSGATANAETRSGACRRCRADRG